MESGNGQDLPASMTTALRALLWRTDAKTSVAPSLSEAGSEAAPRSADLLCFFGLLGQAVQESSTRQSTGGSAATINARRTGDISSDGINDKATPLPRHKVNMHLHLYLSIPASVFPGTLGPCERHFFRLSRQSERL
jgi:hypothetical protein